MTPSTCCHPNLEFGFIVGLSLLPLGEFYNQSQGEGRWHFASLLCQLLFAGTIHCIQIKLHTVSFSN